MSSVRLALAVVMLVVGGACADGSDGGKASRTATAAGTVDAMTTTTLSATPTTAAASGPEALPADTDLPGAEEGAGVSPSAGAAPNAAAAPPPMRRASGKRAPTGHIEIPAIGVSHPTYEGIDLATINHGPSHWPGTALPGEVGNAVFPGHRTTYTRPFWDIDKLVPGNEVIFTTPRGRFVYRVTRTFVVGARDVWITDPTPDATFTIFACHPKGSARQRYVAKGQLVSSPAGAAGGSPTTAPPPPPSSTTTSPSTTTTAPPPEEPPGVVPGLPG